MMIDICIGLAILFMYLFIGGVLGAIVEADKYDDEALFYIKLRRKIKMSLKYNKYLSQHFEGVMNAYDWLRENLPDVVVGTHRVIIENHDASKYSESEYAAYDAYFYGKEKTDRVVEEFNKAWLHHIHHNPHHWQHWILVNDNPDEGEIILDMPYEYIVEMICDWWSFSWSKGKLTEIFEWYDGKKDYIKLSDKTRKTVEDILEKIREKLEEDTDED